MCITKPWTKIPGQILDQTSGFWQKASIRIKFGLSGSFFLFLIVMIAATGYISLKSIQKKGAAILLSSEIQRLVLEMDRGLEKSRRLYGDFFLQYPIIGYERAHEQYIQPSIQQISKVITLEALADKKDHGLIPPYTA